MISAIHYVIDRHFNTYVASDQVLVTNVDKQVLKGAVSDILKNIQTQLNPKSPWFDKTGNPDMIQTVPVLLRLWPSCCFIFAKRRGIENVYSRRRKFASHSFDYHCRDWARNMSSWRMIRESLRSEQFLEVDQHEIAVKAEMVATRLASFLNLTNMQKISMQKTFETTRPQQTEPESAMRVLSLNNANWSTTEIDTFLKICYEEMRLYGYSTDEQYYNHSGPIS